MKEFKMEKADERDGATLFLTVQGILQHNEEAKFQQGNLLEMLYKRADLEDEYHVALNYWQDKFEDLLKENDFVYNTDIRETLSLLSKEAEIAANIHQHVSKRIKEDSCDLLENAIKFGLGSGQEKKVENLLSDFCRIQSERSGLISKLKKCQQSRNQAISARKDVAEQVNGDKRYGSLPLTEGKIQELKKRLRQLDSNLANQNQKVHAAEEEITSYLNTKAKKLHSVAEQLENVSQIYLDNTIMVLQKTFQVFRQQEELLVRKDKQKLLFKSDQLLHPSRLKTFKGHCIDKVKAKVSEQISSDELLTHVKPVGVTEKKPERTFKENAEKQSERLFEKPSQERGEVPNIPGTCGGQDGLPEGSVAASLSTRMFPRSLHLKSTQSTPANVGIVAPNNTSPLHVIDTIGAFYAKSNDSIEEKKKLKKCEPVELIWKKPSNLWSCQSDSSVEEIPWIPETPAPDTEYRKLQVQEFCVSDTESDHSSEEVYRPQTRIRKICSDSTSTSDEEETQEEEEYGKEEGEITLSDQPDVSEDEESEGEIARGEEEKSKYKKKDGGSTLKHDVTHLRETRVIARYDYRARSNGEISFKRGQVIKQKLGEDEYGFSYGWVRSNKLAQKHYGYYPAKMVTALSDEDVREP